MNLTQFCYWLQGYFEIALQPSLNLKKLSLIKKYLVRMQGDRHPFINWLLEVCHYIERTNNCCITIEEFMPAIQRNLSAVFLHVIDDCYAVSKEERLKIHWPD